MGILKERKVLWFQKIWIHSRPILRYAFVLAFAWCSVTAVEARPIILDPDLEKFPAGLFLEILEDPAGRLDFETIRRGPGRGPGWTPSLEEIPNFTFSSSVYWLRMEIQNPGRSDRDLLLELASARHDYIDAYIELDPGEFEITRTGDRRAFHTRKHHHRHFIFDVPVPALSTRTIYFRLESHDGLHESIPLFLWEPDAFSHNDSLRHHVLGILLGVLLIMALYNLFITVSLLDLSYFFYVLLLFALVGWFFAHHGFAAMLLWPAAHNWGNQIIPFTTNFALLMGLLFTRYYVNYPARLPGFDLPLKILSGLIILNIILIILGFYSFTHLIFYGLGSAAFLLITFSGIRSLREDYGPARFLLLALGLLVAGGGLASLRDSGVIAHSLFTENVWAVGLFSGAVLLSLGLADRINLIRREKEAAQRETLLFQNELELARQIQQSLLPRSTPEVPGLKIAVRYQPMENVGGDFYDFRVENGRLATLLADVSGHGVPAALIVSIVKIAFSLQKNNLANPGEVLARMNEILYGHVGNEFVTASFAWIDPVHKKLIAGNAGHPALLVRKRSSGELTQIRPFGRLLGIMPDASWDNEEVSLASGDRILLYTDGVYEAENAEQQQFGPERLRQCLADADELSAEEFLDQFIQTVTDWSGGPSKIRDDIALTCIDVL